MEISITKHENGLYLVVIRRSGRIVSKYFTLCDVGGIHRPGTVSEEELRILVKKGLV